MGVALGNLNISGTAEERTWNITIDTPASGTLDPLNAYTFTVHREIVIIDGDGQHVVLIRDTETAALHGFDDFRPNWRFTAGQAVAAKASILTDIVTTVETLIAQGKA